jgi:hypothetical protein
MLKDPVAVPNVAFLEKPSMETSTEFVPGIALASKVPVKLPVGGEVAASGRHNCTLLELPSFTSASRISSMFTRLPKRVDVQRNATPYWVVPKGSCTRSVPLLGSVVAAQFPLPIFSATATGLGSEKVIVTVEGAGVGVGPGVAELPPPQPVEMATNKKSNATKSKDRTIRKCLVDIASPAWKSVTF